jgi:ribokinase
MESSQILPLIVLGSINVDLVMQVERLPAPGETVLADRLDRHPGGKGANQAVAGARMGASVAMIGAVGDDADGTYMLGIIGGEGVDTGGIARIAGQPTGTAHIAIDRAGENFILVVGGANRALAYDATDPAPAVRLAQLESPLDVVAAFLAGRGDAEDEGGGIRILNAAPYVEAGKALFGSCDIVVVNETELAGYAAAEAVPETEEAVIDAARRLLADDRQQIVVTRGAEGVVAVSRDGHLAVPARPAQVVDTTGAGDCFCGVLAAALAEHRPLTDALRVAACAGSLAVEHEGAIPSLPHRDAILATLA